MDNRYQQNRAGRCLWTAAFALLGVALLGVLTIGYLVRFFTHNLVINGLIVAVFLSGLALVFLNLMRLAREERLANLVARRSFQEKREGWDPAHLLDRLPRSSVRTRVAQVRELGARHGTLSQEGLAEIVMSEEAARAAVVRYLVGILVFLGLLGTFLGLLLTVEGVGEVLRGLEWDPYADMQVFLRQLRDDLGRPLEGMATAFSTSLFGLGASVILGFLGLQFTRGQEFYLAKINDLTMVYLGPALAPARPVEVLSPAAAGPRSVAPARPGGDMRSLEAGARYLEAGARALQDDITAMTDMVTRSEASHQELRASMAELAEAVRQGASALTRIETEQRTAREESVRLLEEQVRHARSAGEVLQSLRSVEEKLGEAVAGLQRLQPAAEERDRLLRSSLERESRTLAGQISTNFSDLAELEDAAAREVCRRISDGLQSVREAVESLRGQGAASRGRAPAPPAPGAGSGDGRDGDEDGPAGETP